MSLLLKQVSLFICMHMFRAQRHNDNWFTASKKFSQKISYCHFIFDAIKNKNKKTMFSYNIINLLTPKHRSRQLENLPLPLRVSY